MMLGRISCNSGKQKKIVKVKCQSSMRSAKNQMELRLKSDTWNGGK